MNFLSILDLILPEKISTYPILLEKKKYIHLSHFGLDFTHLPLKTLCEELSNPQRNPEIAKFITETISEEKIKNLLLFAAKKVNASLDETGKKSSKKILESIIQYIPEKQFKEVIAKHLKVQKYLDLDIEIPTNHSKLYYGNHILRTIEKKFKEAASKDLKKNDISPYIFKKSKTNTNFKREHSKQTTTLLAALPQQIIIDLFKTTTDLADKEALILYILEKSVIDTYFKNVIGKTIENKLNIEKMKRTKKIINNYDGSFKKNLKHIKILAEHISPHTLEQTLIRMLKEQHFTIAKTLMSVQQANHYTNKIYKQAIDGNWQNLGKIIETIKPYVSYNTNSHNKY